MPIPVIEFLHLIMKLKDNRPFIYIGRYFCLCLVALAVIGCADEWIIALDPGSVPCIRGRFECYQGPPLSLPEFVFNAGASDKLFMLPVLYIIASLLLAFKPPHTYLILLLLSMGSFVIELVSEPQPYVYSLYGSGKWLYTLAISFIITLAIPLTINELTTRYPDYDHQGIFKYFSWSR